MQRVLAILLIAILHSCPVHAAVERIVETFNGDGEFDSVGRPNFISGVDNPGWSIFGNGRLVDGGYSFINGMTKEDESDTVERKVDGMGSFISRMELRNFDLGEINDDSSLTADSTAQIVHQLGNAGGSSVRMLITETDDNDTSSWLLSMLAGDTQIVANVPRGNHVAMEIAFDAFASMAKGTSTATTF